MGTQIVRLWGFGEVFLEVRSDRKREVQGQGLEAPMSGVRRSMGRAELQAAWMVAL